MRTRLLRPSWLLMHVLVAAGLIAMVELGRWQWGRGEATGSLRNYSYGVEWCAFAALTLVGWVKFCRDEAAVADQPDPAEPVATVPQQLPPVAQPVSAEEDPDLAAWNDRFAELARRDREAST